MFLLILGLFFLFCRGLLPLHSIMFLLIRQYKRNHQLHFTTLHSIMFLLILLKHWPYVYCPTFFTFHNVSINTESLDVFTPADVTLHSIMFLLIPGSPSKSERHYLSLHSIMFLLILKARARKILIKSLYIP